MINLEMTPAAEAHVKEYQGKIKAQRPGNYSLQSTINRILVEHKELIEKVPNYKEFLPPMPKYED